MLDALAFDPATETRLATAPIRPRVVVLSGAGIGPEVTRASMAAIRAAGADLDLVECDMPEGTSAAGRTAPPRETLAAIEQAGLVLRGPLDAYSGRVMGPTAAALRLAFGLNAHLRMARGLPGVGLGPSAQRMACAFVHETLEGAARAALERRHGSRPASRRRAERLADTALRAAACEGRSRIASALREQFPDAEETALWWALQAGAHGDRDLKLSQISTDACARRLVEEPARFGVVVSSSLDGAVLAELACGLAGGRYLAPSADIGDAVAAFGPVHGGASELAGLDLANPTATILAGAMLLRHVGQTAAARRIEAGVRAVYATGRRLTRDASRGAPVGLEAFTDAVLEAIVDQEAASGIAA